MMYLRRLSLLIFLLQCLLLTRAGIPHPDVPDAEPEPPVPEPEPQSPAEQPGSPNGGTNNVHPGGVPVPNAKPVGADPNAASDDEGIDIKEIGEKLKDLIDDISSIIDAVTPSSTSMSTSTDDSGNVYTTAIVAVTTQITSRPFPSLGAGCTSAQSAYAACYNPTQSIISGASPTANFTALAPTQQASCLCNASPGIDFNAIMKSCYDWTNAQQNKTSNDKSLSSQFSSYASAIASGTALCAPSSNACASAGSAVDIIACEEGGAGSSSSSAPSPSTTPAPTGAPASSTSPSTGGGGRAMAFGDGSRMNGWYLMPVAASLMLAFANSLG